MYNPGSKEAYDEHRAEVTINKWCRNIMGLGILAATAAVNTAEMTTTQHLELSAGGLALAAGTAYLLEKARRESIHDSHIEAAFAHINARAGNYPVPGWANGNTGSIFDTVPEILPDTPDSLTNTLV
jgi:hypothetical protein